MQFGEVAEAEGGSAQVLKPSVACLGGAVGGAGAVEKASTSAVRWFNVRASRLSSTTAAGTPSRRQSMTAIIDCLVLARSGSR